jgi:hemolysin III
MTAKLYDELANSVTHGIGLVLSLCGFAVLLYYSIMLGTALHTVSCSIYGATLIALYTASTLYHSSRVPRIKQLFKIADHSCIFLLIAGTYTPFMLVNLRGGWGWSIFGVVWGLAIIGVIGKVIFPNRFERALTWVYVLMGWLVIIAIKPLVMSVLTGGLILIFTGGLFYMAGLYFFIKEEMKYAHAIWHLFVMAGSISHYFAILFYVLPSHA